MALSGGNRLGPYEIVGPLGAGGMGEVYRARDTRLDRTVAIKVLPPQFATDSAFRERFDREARAIAALNHPHICTLHDVGRQDGVDYLVMEHLDGQTLAERLEKGALALDQTLRYAIQIADALDKAHRQGIVHRDLKPGNVMLTKGGAKLLDFGLAKAGPTKVGLYAWAVGAELASPFTSLQTTPPDLTAHGTILGTSQYMASEQLEGQEADARTDLFAFGALVYEMATGKKAFEGKSQASLIGAILKDDPSPIAATQSLTPPALDRVVKKCLAKDPAERWQSAKDLCDELKWIAENGPSASIVASGRTPSRFTWREKFAWATALASIAAAGMLLTGVWPRAAPAGTRPLRLSIVHAEGSEVGTPAISPDSTRVAYGARRDDGIPLLWVRDLATGEAQALIGTEGVTMPF